MSSKELFSDIMCPSDFYLKNVSVEISYDICSCNKHRCLVKSRLWTLTQNHTWCALNKERWCGMLSIISTLRIKTVIWNMLPPDVTLTLTQWPSSGNPVAIQCAWNLDPSVLWNAIGEMPVAFQWSSSGFPVVFQCVPIMQINTGSPLGHHWVQASASVLPVASQCTCGSSGLPVCSNYAN